VNAAFIVGLLVLSSLLLWVLATRRRRSRRAWAAAVCEFVGLWAACFALNLALGIAIILAVRTATPLFISIYVLNDASLALVSALQGFVLYWRRDHGAATEAV
jgi:hypothetical protein